MQATVSGEQLFRWGGGIQAQLGVFRVRDFECKKRMNVDVAAKTQHPSQAALSSSLFLLPAAKAWGFGFRVGPQRPHRQTARTAGCLARNRQDLVQ